MPKLLLLAVLLAPGAQDPPKYNVLFVAVDDLKPAIGCYGDALARTPHMDRLAARGLVFNRAYCQQAVCSPSRSSLMTGRRPDTTRVWDLDTHFRKALPDVVTLPQHFKAHGYHAQAFGKIYHPGFDDKPSWSAPTSAAKKPGTGPEGRALLNRLAEEYKAKGVDLSDWRKRPRGLAVEAPDVADSELADGNIADQAIAALETLRDRPFFLAVGFLKPHLPFVAPKKYWDLWKREDFPLAREKDVPQGAPAYAPQLGGELRGYDGMPKQGPLADEVARELIHGYYAATAYMDAQLGRVLDALDRHGLREKTIVVLWGDHGWHLGDHGMWCKHTNYEQAARAPLILSVPGQAGAGRKTDALVEFVDVYPSLVELCGLPVPDGLEGTSFKPLLDDPARPWKSAAFSQYPRGIPGVGRGMGYSMRTERYRFVEWAVPSKNHLEHELYDLEKDPGETLNLATRPEHAELVTTLSARLREGWTKARP